MTVRLLGGGLFVVVAAILGHVAMRYGVQVRQHVNEIAWTTLVAAFLAYPFYNVMNAHGWGMGLRALGARLPASAGIRIWLLSEAAKWLPGSVWGHVSRVVLARKAGVDPVLAAASLPLELLLTVFAWTATAAGGLWLSGAAAQLGREMGSFRTLAALTVLGTVGIVFGYVFIRHSPFRVAQRVREKIERLRALRHIRPRLGGMVLTSLYYTALCVFNGAVFHLLIHAVSKQPPPLAATVGMNAAAWLFGFGVFLAPAGLGAREAALGFFLSRYMPTGEAALAVVLWRFVQLTAEGLWLLVVAVPPLLKGVTPYPVAAPAVGDSQ